MAESDGVHALVSGRVQGVGFRWHARQRARDLGLRGWVANLDDGRAELWAEGAVRSLDELIEWLHRGPASARVEQVLVERGAQTNFLARATDRVAW